MRSGRGSYSEPGSNLAQMKLTLHRSTDMAKLMSKTGNKDDAVWLPLSQITLTSTPSRWVFTVTMPEWLAKKNNLF